MFLDEENHFSKKHLANNYGVIRLIFRKDEPSMNTTTHENPALTAAASSEPVAIGTPIAIKPGYVVCLRKPFRTFWEGEEREWRIGTVKEVINGGRCVALEFDGYDNVRDYGVSCIEWVASSDLEAHNRLHENCPLCGGDGEIEDRSSKDGGTRLCPAPV
jgi:hypothetical protein